MDAQIICLLLADDDRDDHLLFGEALSELLFSTQLSTVNDGEQLMQQLTEQPAPLPDVLFLDLNMPRKNGLQCLEEIKRDEQLKHLPVIIYSTSLKEDVVDLVYKNGAQHYIRKPAEFSQLKKVIHYALTLVAQKNSAQPTREKFVITGNSTIHSEV